jgi:hypothetical protein
MIGMSSIPPEGGHVLLHMRNRLQDAGIGPSSACLIFLRDWLGGDLKITAKSEGAYSAAFAIADVAYAHTTPASPKRGTSAMTASKNTSALSIRVRNIIRVRAAASRMTSMP